MDKALSFVEYDERLANALEVVKGTLLEVYGEILANISTANIPPEEKIRLCAAAANGLSERLLWHPPPHFGRPAKEYDPKKAVLAAPYASLSKEKRTGQEGPVDRFVRHLGGKKDES